MTDEEIYAEFESAKKAADELNKHMKDHSYRKSPWRYLFAAMAAYGAAELIGGLVTKLFTLFAAMYFMISNEAASIGIIGGADGPTAIFVTTPGWMHYINPILFLIIGVYGFLRLRKCKQK